jgi:hypothetical protein
MGVLHMASIKDYCNENNPKAVNYDGLEAAIIGVGQQYTKPAVLIYSAKKIIQVLMKQGMTYNEALDYYGHNIECMWVGAEETPIIMDDLSVDLKEKDQVHEPTDKFTKGESHALTPRSNQGGRCPAPRKNVSRVQSRVRSTHRRRN